MYIQLIQSNFLFQCFFPIFPSFFACFYCVYGDYLWTWETLYTRRAGWLSLLPASPMRFDWRAQNFFAEGERNILPRPYCWSNIGVADLIIAFSSPGWQPGATRAQCVQFTTILFPFPKAKGCGAHDGLLCSLSEHQRAYNHRNPRAIYTFHNSQHHCAKPIFISLNYFSFQFRLKLPINSFTLSFWFNIFTIDRMYTHKSDASNTKVPMYWRTYCTYIIYFDFPLVVLTRHGVPRFFRVAYEIEMYKEESAVQRLAA